jgi:transposase-like protein
MACPACGSLVFIKSGPKKGAQRFRCKTCGRYWTDRAPRFNDETKAKAVDMYLNNVGIRKIARFTGASPAGVLRWIRKAHVHIEGQRHSGPDGQANSAGFTADIIEMDEIYTFVQKKDKEQSSGPRSAAG